MLQGLLQPWEVRGADGFIMRLQPWEVTRCCKGCCSPARGGGLMCSFGGCSPGRWGDAARVVAALGGEGGRGAH